METIKFKRKFEKKLKGVKDEFLKNIRLNPEAKTDDQYKEYCNKLNNFSNYFYVFVGAAFPWDETPEGEDYWRKISLR